MPKEYADEETHIRRFGACIGHVQSGTRCYHKLPRFYVEHCRFGMTQIFVPKAEARRRHHATAARGSMDHSA